MSATAESIDVRITGDASGATGAMTRVGEAVSGAVTVMQQKLIDLGLASKESFALVGVSSLTTSANVVESGNVIRYYRARHKRRWRASGAGLGIARQPYRHDATAACARRPE